MGEEGGGVPLSPPGTCIPTELVDSRPFLGGLFAGYLGVGPMHKVWCREPAEPRKVAYLQDGDLWSFPFYAGFVCRGFVNVIARNDSYHFDNTIWMALDN